MLMHDADDGPDVIGAPPGAAGNNTPEPWDNHGTDGMNILFADGHAITARPYKVSATGKSQIDQIWDMSDCGQHVDIPPGAPGNPVTCP
jgi:prepilin-type processing-associated H-X9-DG protein